MDEMIFGNSYTNNHTAIVIYTRWVNVKDTMDITS